MPSIFEKKKKFKYSYITRVPLSYIALKYTGNCDLDYCWILPIDMWMVIQSHILKKIPTTAFVWTVIIGQYSGEFIYNYISV